MGEQVDITTQGLGLTLSNGSDGTLSGQRLTAGSTAGTATVSTAARGTLCTANSITFTIIAPPIIHYENADSSTYHVQGYASIGIKISLYAAPDTVSFQHIWISEGTQNYTATGAWQCKQGLPHEPAPVPVPMTATVTPGLGTLANGTDSSDSGYCPNVQGGQIQTSSLTINIPTQYGMQNGPPYSPIGSVSMATNETVINGGGDGDLTKTKDDAHGHTTVNSANSPF